MSHIFETGVITSQVRKALTELKNFVVGGHVTAFNRLLGLCAGVRGIALHDIIQVGQPDCQMPPFLITENIKKCWCVFTGHEAHAGTSDWMGPSYLLLRDKYLLSGNIPATRMSMVLGT